MRVGQLRRLPAEKGTPLDRLDTRQHVKLSFLELSERKFEGPKPVQSTLNTDDNDIGSCLIHNEFASRADHCM